MNVENYFVFYKFSDGAAAAPGTAKEGPYSMKKALARRLDLGQNANSWIEVEHVCDY